MAAAEADRYGLPTLRRHGFEVEVLDVSALVRRRAVPAALLPRGAEALPCVPVGDAAALAGIVRREAAAGSVFSDNLVALGDIDFGTERIFRTLRENGGRYIVVSAAALPRPGAAREGPFAGVRALAAKAADPARLAGSLFERGAAVARRAGVAYPMPETVFSGPSPLLARFQARTGFPDARVVPVQSLDYSTYLDFLAAGPVPAQDGTCVFLDEAATHHRDSHMLGLPLMPPEEYFPRLERLFSFIERRWGLRVVVAAHPTSRYAPEDGPFGGRPLVKGRTLELVARSSLVVAHASTAVAFAVLMRKPLLFSVPGPMRDHHAGAVARTLAESLGTRTVDFDEPEGRAALEAAGDGPWPLDAARYDAYRDAYIRYPGIADEPVWQTVARTLGAKC